MKYSINKLIIILFFVVTILYPETIYAEKNELNKAISYSFGGKIIDKNDSIALLPSVINVDKETPITRQFVESANNPIVRRHYEIKPELSQFTTQVGNEILMSYNLIGTVEYADGSVKTAELTDKSFTGQSVTNFLMYGLSLNDFEHSKILSSSWSDNFYDADYKEGDPIVLEYTGDSQYDQDLMGLEFYQLRNFDSMKSWDKKSFKTSLMGINNKCSTYNIGPLIDYYRENMPKKGIDPDNFDSINLRFNPTVRFESKLKIEDEDINIDGLGIDIRLALFGYIYAEGGLGENCSLMVTSELPSSPKCNVSRRRIDKGSYMDAWEVKATLETEQYGQKYIVKVNHRQYMPYPTNEEHKQAAREAGYIVP